MHSHAENNEDCQIFYTDTTKGVGLRIIFPPFGVSRIMHHLFCILLLRNLLVKEMDVYIVQNICT